MHSDYKTMIVELKAGLDKLSADDRAFAGSLVKQFDKKGALSEKQWYWAEKMWARATQPEPKKPEMKQTQVGTMEGLYALFAKAKENGLKYPTITLGVAGAGEVRMTVAGQKAKVPGSLNVVIDSVDEHLVKSREWYGRVLPTGVYEQSTVRETPPAVVNMLGALSGDPVAAIKAYGGLTNRCMFCNSELTDDKSKAAGCGQTCAKRWSIPWGGKKFGVKELTAASELIDAMVGKVGHAELVKKAESTLAKNGSVSDELIAAALQAPHKVHPLTQAKLDKKAAEKAEADAQQGYPKLKGAVGEELDALTDEVMMKKMEAAGDLEQTKKDEEAKHAAKSVMEQWEEIGR
jgi:hypothetical protein